MKNRTKTRSRVALATSELEPLEIRLLFARLTGNDVSQYQGTMNWTTNYNTGNRFALIRGSRSDTLPDTAAATNVPGAKAAGLIVGVYHRALPLGIDNINDSAHFRDPIVDADSFISTSGQWMGAGYIRPVLDMEDGEPLKNAPNHGYTTASWAVAWINRIKQVKNVTPIIYTGSSYASTYLNSSVVAVAPDLWIANWNETTYGNPVTGSGSPPVTPWPSGSWDFWQYGGGAGGWGSFYGASSVEIDRDVFNGSTVDALKLGYVTGCAAAPSGPSPSDGAPNVNAVGVVLNWADATNATAYDVYLDNMTTPVATNIAVSQWSVPSTLTAGMHTWKITAKGLTSDDDTWITGSVWSFTAVLGPVPGSFTNVSPADGTLFNTRTITYQWTASANATAYDLYTATATLQAADIATTSVTLTMSTFLSNYTWHIVAKNANGTYTGPSWNVVIDTAAPTATLGSLTPVTGATSVDFNVTYADAVSGVDFTTLDGSDITVTGPNGYSANASFISVDNASNGTPRVATYRIAAPGGFWNDADNGTYTVTQVASQVRDVATNARPAGTIGAPVSISGLGTAWMSGINTLTVAFDGTTVPLLLNTNGANVRVTKNGSPTDFGNVNNISILGSSADDRLQINAPLTPPLTFTNTNGNDLVEVLAGSYAFNADIATANKNIGLYVASGASAVFNSSQHLRSLSVDGTATFAANGNRVLWVTDLAVTGKLNLADNDLIWDYTAGTPIGAWAGSAYNGLTGLITQARGSGTWTGNGLGTDQASAMGPTPLTNLGIAEASDVLAYSGATALFDSQTVDTTAVLVKYTYTADADLNGTLTGDDYFRIDSAWPSGSPSYLNGDFDLNGRLDADDYFLLDSNYSHQGVFL